MKQIDSVFDNFVYKRPSLSVDTVWRVYTEPRQRKLKMGTTDSSPGRGGGPTTTVEPYSV